MLLPQNIFIYYSRKCLDNLRFSWKWLRDDLADAMEESVTEFVVKDNEGKKETEMKKIIC